LKLVEFNDRIIPQFAETPQAQSLVDESKKYIKKKIQLRPFMTMTSGMVGSVEGKEREQNCTYP